MKKGIHLLVIKIKGKIYSVLPISDDLTVNPVILCRSLSKKAEKKLMKKGWTREIVGKTEFLTIHTDAYCLLGNFGKVRIVIQSHKIKLRKDKQ